MTQSPDDWEDKATCVGCGAEIAPEVDRAFPCGPDVYLCFECAEERGGVFDADEDRWTVPPDVTNLTDERRPHP